MINVVEFLNSWQFRPDKVLLKIGAYKNAQRWTHQEQISHREVQLELRVFHLITYRVIYGTICSVSRLVTSFRRCQKLVVLVVRYWLAIKTCSSCGSCLFWNRLIDKVLQSFQGYVWAFPVKIWSSLSFQKIITDDRSEWVRQNTNFSLKSSWFDLTHLLIELVHLTHNLQEYLGSEPFIKVHESVRDCYIKWIPCIFGTTANTNLFHSFN